MGIHNFINILTNMEIFDDPNAPKEEKLPIIKQKADVTDAVPIMVDLDSVYADVNGSLKENHEPRYMNIKKRFKEMYGVDP